MRELKFRAWVYYGQKLEKPHYSRDYASLDRFFEDHDENDTEQCIEQYTELKDKNGNEICEGDIVNYDDYENYAVEQSKSGAWAIGKTELFGLSPYCEVIGNIHENPKLLEGEK